MEYVIYVSTKLNHRLLYHKKRNEKKKKKKKKLKRQIEKKKKKRKRKRKRKRRKRSNTLFCRPVNAVGLKIMFGCP